MRQQEIPLRVVFEKLVKNSNKTCKIDFEMILCGFAPIL